MSIDLRFYLLFLEIRLVLKDGIFLFHGDDALLHMVVAPETALIDLFQGHGVFAQILNLDVLFLDHLLLFFNCALQDLVLGQQILSEFCCQLQL